jgi:hypothetical protein
MDQSGQPRAPVREISVYLLSKRLGGRQKRSGLLVGNKNASNPIPFSPNLCLLADSFWLRKLTMDPHILAYVNTKCPDDGYTELKICISELILDSHQRIPVAHVTLHCLLWP